MMARARLVWLLLLTSADADYATCKEDKEVLTFGCNRRCIQYFPNENVKTPEGAFELCIGKSGRPPHLYTQLQYTTFLQWLDNLKVDSSKTVLGLRRVKAGVKGPDNVAWVASYSEKTGYAYVPGIRLGTANDIVAAGAGWEGANSNANKQCAVADGPAFVDCDGTLGGKGKGKGEGVDGLVCEFVGEGWKAEFVRVEESGTEAGLVYQSLAVGREQECLATCGAQEHCMGAAYSEGGQCSLSGRTQATPPARAGSVFHSRDDSPECRAQKDY